MMHSFIKKHFHHVYLFGGLLLTIATGCGSTSGIIIAPEQDFVLGGNTNDFFNVTVVNDGDVPILLSERLVYGEAINLGLLTSGDRRRVSFLAGSAAVFTNPTKDTAQLILRIKGNPGLTKEFQPR